MREETEGRLNITTGVPPRQTFGGGKQKNPKPQTKKTPHKSTCLTMPFLHPQTAQY